MWRHSFCECRLNNQCRFLISFPFHGRRNRQRSHHPFQQCQALRLLMLRNNSFLIPYKCIVKLFHLSFPIVQAVIYGFNNTSIALKSSLGTIPLWRCLLGENLRSLPIYSNPKIYWGFAILSSVLSDHA